MLLTDINDFLLFCELTKQYSQNTVKSYSHSLRKLYTFLNHNNIKSSEDITPQIIDKYRLNLDSQISLQKSKLSIKTMSYSIIVLRSFLKYLLEQNRNVQPPEKFILPKTQNRQIEYLTQTEIELILNVIETCSENKDKHLDELIKSRNKAIIQTITHSGFRISEILGLTKSSFESDPTKVAIKGKGGKVRMIFISNTSKDLIQTYLSIRGQDQNPYLFASSRTKNKQTKSDSKSELHKYKPLTPRLIQQIVHKYALMAGVNKQITPHIFRHTFATTALKKGADLRSVQIMLGHSNISTTQLYTHVTQDELAKTHSKIFNDMSPI